MRWRYGGCVAGCFRWLGLLLLNLVLLQQLTLDRPIVAEAFVDAKGCNRTVRNSVGWIRWTGRMGRCVIRIRAPLKDPQVIEMRIRRMQVGVLKNARCVGAYVQFSDELEDLDEGAGRYCGHVTGNATRLFLRRGPDLTVVLDSDSRFASENPVIFSAQFSILPARLADERHHHVHDKQHQHQKHQQSHQQHHQQQQQQQQQSISSLAGECPLECEKRNDRRTCRLVSPGYPGIYPRGIRCRVALESSAGRFRIGGSPEDTYNLMNHTSQEACTSEFCEQEHVQADARVEGGQKSQHQADRDEEEDEMILLSPEIPRTATRLKKQRRRKSQFPLVESEQRGLERGGGRQRHREKMELSVEVDGAELDGRNDRGDDRLFWSKNRRAKSQHRHRHHLEQQQHRRSLHRSKKPAPRVGGGASSSSVSCVGDYLALLENVEGQLLEIGKFCGEGRIPQITSRGSNVIVEFHAERDGTIMHDGFHLSIQETEALPTALAISSGERDQPGCEFAYRSAERSRDSVESPKSWYPAGTLCSYRFTGRPNERVSLLLKIDREVDEAGSPFRPAQVAANGNSTCPGNEIAVYNGTHPDKSHLVWSFCDATHADINNIQVPIVSGGNSLLVQFYSATGSYNGQDFAYSMTYKFVKKPANATKRRRDQVPVEETRLISLRPVDFSALNLSETDSCNCDFADRIGNFKSWFIVLVVLGVISFLGAIITIIVLLVKCAKMRAAENKLLQTPNRSIYFKGSTE